MKFGIRLPNSGPLASGANLLAVANEAEKLGFHSVWVHDHVLWGSEQHRTHLSAGSAEALQESQKPNFYESVTTLAYIAAKTQSVKLGIAVLVLPLRNPLVLAKQLANVDVLSEGRLIVGVAPGAPKITMQEFGAVGVDYHSRGKITDEYIAALKALWAENLPSFKGAFVRFKEAQLFPKPSQKNLQILIGGGERGISPRALKRVVELGDGWIPAYLTPEEIHEGVSKIRAAYREMKKPDDPMVVHEMFTAVDESAGKALDSASKSLATNFVSVEEGVKRSLVGSPEQITEKLERYSRAGVDVTELKFIYSEIPRLLEMMRLFARKVLPSFGN